MFSLINFTISSSCRKFCDNWNIIQFFFKSIINMFTNCLNITVK